MDVFWQAPPVSRTIAAGALALSALAHTGILPIYPIIYQTRFLFQVPPEIWRPLTAFLLTGPGLSIILEPFMLYRYGSALEKDSPRFSQPGDFFTYTAFVMFGILLSSGVFLGSFVFLSTLSLAYAYTYSQDNPTTTVQFFIISFQAKFLPLAMLLMTFVMQGPQAALRDAMGIVAAHMYDFLTRIWPAFGGASKEPLIKTPQFVADAFGAVPGSRNVTHRSHGTAHSAPVPGRAPTSSQWGNRGPGHRLG